jgi:DNA-directed RNA polymerase omega subunit
MRKVLSRTLELDTQQCVKNVGDNKYDLVLIAAARARELARQNRENPDLITKGSPISALLEIQQGLVGREYLLKVKK